VYETLYPYLRQPNPTRNIYIALRLLYRCAGVCCPGSSEVAAELLFQKDATEVPGTL
jgi:hypothetical protein